MMIVKVSLEDVLKVLLLFTEGKKNKKFLPHLWWHWGITMSPKSIIDYVPSSRYTFGH